MSYIKYFLPTTLLFLINFLLIILVYCNSIYLFFNVELAKVLFVFTEYEVFF